ncbi:MULTISPECIES: phosphate signaling complex PhoU family protein [unclassified Archaeoglobus]|jgi:phosphate uptake regulator|uniref:phosphate signaling complex PhoU family protein n=1 Tax=unclassified Archaeoglobus TaxID=2643606 RepID=UPI0025BBC68D|nr:MULTISPECIES: phosphate uptake regulator PhoU [unclassified Archaeoglobus]
MEVRKLQLIGGSSYMVSLPKTWVKSNELKQGDDIFLQVEDSVITLYPKSFRDFARVTSVQIDELPRLDERFVRRYIYALYLQGIDEIVITDEKINARAVSKIGEIVKDLIGMEIIDASEGKVVLKCLTSTDFDVYGVVRRMTQIIQSMIETVIDGIEKGDTEALKDIQNLEKDSDRLYLLAVRQEHRLVREFSSPSKWNELRLILGIRTVAKLLEEISDALYNFSTYAIEMKYDELKEVKKYFEKLNVAFEKLSKAYFNSNVSLSEESIEDLEKLEETLLSNMKGSVYYRLALETLLSACRHMKSIGEIAFNKSVRESLREMRKSEKMRSEVDTR